MAKDRVLVPTIITLIAVLVMLTMVGTAAMAGGAKEKTAPEPAEEAPAAQTPAAEAATAETAAAKEEPQYGGTLTILNYAELDRWNPIGTNSAHKSMIYEPLIWGKWGLPLEQWAYGGPYFPEKYWEGCLAESWEMPDPRTVTFKIRKGVHFFDKPPANGRELVAKDVKWYIETWIATPSTDKRDLGNVESVSCEGDYSLTVKLKEPRTRDFLDQFRGDTVHMMIACPEVAQGPEGIDAYNDWRNALGTGPFIPIENVVNNYQIFEKNPNYWQFDRNYPDNRLPYVDKVQRLVITDVNTYLAAIRTGQVDMYTAGTSPGGQVQWKYVDELKEAKPYLKWRREIGHPGMLGMHCQQKPFTDLRVRRALNMAIDYPSIVKDYYKGSTELAYKNWPWMSDWGDWSIKENELTDIIKEQFSYNPEKAKKLLAEAGYPNGFKTELWTFGPFVELCVVVSEYLAQVGVDCKVEVKEFAAHQSAKYNQTYTGILAHTTGCGNLQKHPVEVLESWYLPGPLDIPAWKDPKFIGMMDEAKSTFDDTKRRALYKEAAVYALEQAPYIMLPPRVDYSVWQPWVKGYRGEYGRFYGDKAISALVWLDLDLKEQLIGKR